jgi:hypothetical protein
MSRKGINYIERENFEEIAFHNTFKMVIELVSF